ncbi:acyltransferase domain-containing protein [Streptomyces sp. NBC_00846]|uniref:type I polyketide synthase n=1 Tax=Streptomyces sp. NBC_00846 TaxID=2975849 RepID=UPI00386CD0A3|nr:acyltransferase domain-containing protein [Streptomyces sp. NBC_00846]
MSVPPARSSAARPAAGEPIAVVGMACRLPGAGTPEAYWSLLSEGRDAVGMAPADRRTDGPRLGAFLPEVDRFDAAFFGISPAEAAAMDPQQRLVLELAWEALEQARIVPATLEGSPAGVFVGAITGEYALLHDRAGGGGRHDVTGTHRSLIANRVSHLLGLRGPSLTVDSGQSSSLVAVQLACEELRRGTVSMALAGGVNLNLLAETDEALDRFGALSPDGRCHTFDDRANGYVRGEGGGLVVLKPLSAALADGDGVHCLILGGAVNNGTGEHLTVPDADAQRQVVEQACAAAGVRPADVAYVELHGTGTAVGDPVEAAALGAVFGAGLTAGGDEPSEPLLVGSVKTNIGHLEGAAGIAGLLKTALSLRHGVLPASLNFLSPNPRIPLAELGLEVVAGARPWPAGRVAGVSAFGMGGTNAHLIVAPAPHAAAPATAVAPEAARPAEGPTVWTLSARSAAALRGQAGRLAEHLDTRPGLRAEDVAVSLLRTRSRFEHRAVIIGSGPDAHTELGAGAEELAAGLPGAAVVEGRVLGGRRVFVFSGQGSQWAGMARELMDVPGPFADRLADCARALAPYTDFDLRDVLREAPGSPGLDGDDVVQPALWAVTVSLAALWRSRGVEPDAVLGHSQGEIAAATVIGALGLDDAARIVAVRSRLLRALDGGGMLSAALSAEQVQARLDRTSAYGGLCVSVVNSPSATVVSGPVDDLNAFAAALDADGVRVRILPVAYASHSPAVEAIRDELLEALAPVRPRPVSVPFYSSLTGGLLNTAGLDAEHWYRSLRSPVRFADATRAALADGCALFVECTPHPVLCGAIEQTAEAEGREAAAVGTLRRDAGGPAQLLRALAEAHVRGADVDWAPEAAPAGSAVVDLPTYAFQRERHWLDGAPGTRRRTARRDPATAPVPLAPAAVLAGRASTAVRELVVTATAVVLGHADASVIDPGRSFRDLGLDSQGTVDLRNRLGAATGLPLPSTLIFEYPTPARLAAHLAVLVAGQADDTAPAEDVHDAPGTEDGDDAEPIAIVAMGCRYPGGADTPEKLWRLVADGTEAVGPLPDDRGWDLDALTGERPGRPGPCATTAGGFLREASLFDAAFFGIGPREALAMDPQQRLLLETCWEALERAGIDPASLEGRPVGVFAGAMASDYGPRLHQPAGGTDGHLLTGTASSVVSGRIAYSLGLRGPALTVDTACSSSLVAVHLAVRALRAGECPLALAGGVTVMSTPGLLVEFSKQGGLAADGRAKPFSDAADGTSFGEGAGVLVLERLCDARRNGHPVLAVIRGTAVNQDGASNGLTAPDGQAQRQVVLGALADAGLTTDDVDAVEAHGTGTKLGDPVEANALIDTYGRPAADQTSHPVWLGSVKSNIGHTQAAAGVAGVIKMVQALRHELLPAGLHAERPTPRADWAKGRVRLLTADRPWPRGERTRRASVSSFGISGTNAHLIVEESPAQAGPAADAHDEPAGTPLVWPVSAQSEASLRAQAARLAEAAAAPHPADTARALAGRTVFPHRAVVVGTGRDEPREALAALAAGNSAPGLVTGTARRPARTAVLFTGQGSQRPGMGRELYAVQPVFAAALDEICAALDPHLERPLRDLMWAGPGTPEAALLDRTRYAQPALFAFEAASWRLLRELGVSVDAVAGHSVGEFAAAYAAGVWELGDVAGLVAARGRLMDELPEGGAMFAISATAEEVLATLVGREDEASLAAVNGPHAVVVSGTLDACEAIAAHWAGLGRRTKRLTVSHAFHSPLMEPVLDRFREEAERVSYAEPRLAHERATDGGRRWTDPEYWVEQVRATVLFAPLTERLAQAGTGVFLEVGPQAQLAGPLRECLAERGPDRSAGPADRAAAVVATARRGRDEHTALLHGLAGAFVAGTAVDWAAALPEGPRAELPTYAFDRRRFWLTDTGGTGAGPAYRTTAVADGGLLLDARLSRRSTAWLADHVIGGVTVVPGTALLELALRAAAAAGATEVASLTLTAPVVLPAEGALDAQVTVGAADPLGQRPLTLHTRPAGSPDATWTPHAVGRTAGPTAALATDGAETDWAAAWPPPGASPLDLSDGYGRLADAGYGYGPAFRGLRAAWRAGDDLYAEVRLPAAVAAEGSLIHPALLDAVLHPLVLEAPGSRLVPFAFSAAEVACAGTDALRVRLSREGDRVRLTLRDTRNRPVGRVFVALRHAAAGFGTETAGTPAADAPETGTPVPERAPGEDPSGRVPEPRKEHGAGAGTVAPTGAEGFTPESLLELVREKAADLLGHGAPEEVEIDKPFTDLGFDSMGAVELQDHLEMATGLPLAATLVFDHPTVADVAAHLTELLGSATPSAADDGPAAPDPALARLREALDDVTALPAAGPEDGTGAGDGRRDAAEALLWDALRQMRGDHTTGDLADELDLVSDDALFEFIDTQL